MKRTAPIVVFLTAVVCGILAPDHEMTRADAESSLNTGTTCLVTGSMHIEASKANPYPVGTVTVGEDCKLSHAERSLSAEEFAQLTKDGMPSNSTRSAGSSDQSTDQLLLPEMPRRARATVRAEHVQIMMTQVDSEMTWLYNGSSVLSYSDGLVTASVGGCGWHTTDGPYSWWEPSEMPTTAYIYGWAFFETNCTGVDGGWMEAAAYGTGVGSYGADCDYSMALPIGSSVQCYPTRIW